MPRRAAGDGLIRIPIFAIQSFACGCARGFRLLLALVLADAAGHGWPWLMQASWVYFPVPLSMRTPCSYVLAPFPFPVVDDILGTLSIFRPNTPVSIHCNVGPPRRVGEAGCLSRAGVQSAVTNGNWLRFEFRPWCLTGMLPRSPLCPLCGECTNAFNPTGTDPGLDCSRAGCHPG